MLTTVQRFSLLTILACAAILCQPCGSSVAIETTGTTTMPTCNGKKAVTIGCPIEQRDCSMRPCGNAKLCATRVCWATVGVQSGPFRCDPPNAFDLQAFNTWLCYPMIRVSGTIIYPAVAICLNIEFCQYLGVFKKCQPDPNAPGTKLSFIYTTTNACVLPS
jgi:hypothetical protein